MNIKTVLTAVSCIAIPLSVGGLSGYFTVEGVRGWYTTLHKPFFNPPNWLFGPVWTLLYILMGVSLFLIVQSPVVRDKPVAITLFAIQLVLNFLWSIIFFKWQSTGWALLEIIALWFFIALTIRYFGHINITAARLLVPYILWVSFATILNASLWWLNRVS